MNIKRISEAWPLALLVRETLTASTVKFDDAGRVILRGHMNLSHDGIETEVAVPCEFHIPPNWKFSGPRVFSSAKFVRRNINWHVYKTPRWEGQTAWSEVCWGLGDQWQDNIAAIHAPEIRVMWAAQFLIRSAKSLFYRHMLACQLGILEWTWPAWDHGHLGKNQYYKWKHHQHLTLISA
jgi:hypothetical protein